MKIDFFSNEKQLPGSKKEKNKRLLLALDCTAYDMIVIYSKGETVSSGKVIRQVKKREKCSVITLVNGKMSHLKQTKYRVFFNGQSFILDIQDIHFLESYYRKTSVVVDSGRIRIRARLDEEEEKLPKDQFVRINRHNIINMNYVRNVKGEAIEMQNGEYLYVNDGRKKKFEKRYREFLELNYMLL
ncbi:LytR/AlgR family response regulator transcription factor [Lacrimispora sp. JR3]|uniref:LytR/AlgR family response regulator transcription factor n=1 Tax=Lacrimispora sinapis TaxID=3111456 RepID=UPI003748B458